MMSFLTRLLANAQRIGSFACNSASFHTLTSREVGVGRTGVIFNSLVRTVIRVHFPRPCERKRILRHGWHARMATKDGRRILMRRILKGRFVYSH